MSKLNDLIKKGSPTLGRLGKSKSTDKTVALTENGEGTSVGVVEHKFTPSMPRINVLPDEIVEKYATGALIRKLVFGGVAVVVLIGATFGAGAVMDASHSSQLAALDQQGSALQGQISALQPYQLYKDGVEAKRSSLSSVLTSDVDMSKILKDLNDSAEGNNVEFSTVSLALTGGAGGASGSSATCFNPDPFSTTATIGCVTLAGTSSNKDEVNGFFVELNKTNGFTNSFISSVTNAPASGENASGNTTTFSGSISITSAFYSSKYADLASPLDQVISGGTNAKATSLSTELKSTYPQVFAANYDASAITTVATQTCKNLSDGKLDYKSALANITSIASTSKAPADSTRDKKILSTIVNSNCPANSGILEG